MKVKLILFIVLCVAHSTRADDEADIEDETFDDSSEDGPEEDDQMAPTSLKASADNVVNKPQDRGWEPRTTEAPKPVETNYFRSMMPKFNGSLLQLTARKAINDWQRLFNESESRRMLAGFGRSLVRLSGCVGGDWLHTCSGQKWFDCAKHEHPWSCIVDIYCNAKKSGLCKVNTPNRSKDPNYLLHRKNTNATLNAFHIGTNCETMIDCLTEMGIAWKNKFNDVYVDNEMVKEHSKQGGAKQASSDEDEDDDDDEDDVETDEAK